MAAPEKVLPKIANLYLNKTKSAIHHESRSFSQECARKAGQKPLHSAEREGDALFSASLRGLAVNQQRELIDEEDQETQLDEGTKNSSDPVGLVASLFSHACKLMLFRGFVEVFLAEVQVILQLVVGHHFVTPVLLLSSIL
jgi:hypothetical protein